MAAGFGNDGGVIEQSDALAGQADVDRKPRDDAEHMYDDRRVGGSGLPYLVESNVNKPTEAGGTADDAHHASLIGKLFGLKFTLHQLAKRSAQSIENGNGGEGIVDSR